MVQQVHLVLFLLLDLFHPEDQTALEVPAHHVVLQVLVDLYHLLVQVALAVLFRLVVHVVQMVPGVREVLMGP